MGVSVVRVAGMLKCDQSPLPTVNARAMKAQITRTLITVSTFCTFAMRLTPKKFSTVNTAIMAEASICAPPIFSDHVPEPRVNCAFSCFTPGKK
jgi:hypothetical protein